MITKQNCIDASEEIQKDALAGSPAALLAAVLALNARLAIVEAQVPKLAPPGAKPPPLNANAETVL